MTTHIGILPNDVLDALSLTLNDNSSSSPRVRFLNLPHPRTGIPSLFLPYEYDRRSSILEIQAVAPPHARSWFIGENQVVGDGKLLIMTPIDPALLLIPVLRSATSDGGTSTSFRKLDDILEMAASKLCAVNPGDASLTISEKDLSHLASLDCVKSSFSRVCDVKEITPDIIVYRYSSEKLVEYLRGKVARLATPEVFERSNALVRSLAKDGLMEDGKEDLLQLGRVRAACDLVAHYLPADIKTLLLASYNFKQLDDYLRSIKEAVIPANTDSTQNTNSDPTNDVKKRKPQTKSSQGVEKLKKVNTSGMAKLSKFFQKA